MEKLLNLVADVNVNEISSQMYGGTLAQWVDRWQEQMKVELEKYELYTKELDKLRRENLGLKTTIKNLRIKVNRQYHYR